MVIINNTDRCIYICGYEIKPDEREEFEERCFSDINIHSDIGSVEIITEYSIRIIKCFGKLMAGEIKELDVNGLPCISIKERERG